VRHLSRKESSRANEVAHMTMGKSNALLGACGTRDLW
jgi:hypothetical protein